MRVTSGRTLAALSILLLTQGLALAGFTFKIPDGWTNVGEDLMRGQIKGLERQQAAHIEAAMKRGEFVAYAMDMEGAKDGFAENLNAQVVKGALEIDEGFLEKAGAKVIDEAKKAGLVYTLLDKSIVAIGGVPSLRLVGELVLNGQTMKQVCYLVPGGDEHAIITYTTMPAMFDHYQPIFDAAAQGTTGARKAEGRFAHILASAGRGAVFGAIGGAVGALVLGLIARGRRRRTA